MTKKNIFFLTATLLILVFAGSFTAAMVRKQNSPEIPELESIPESTETESVPETSAPEIETETLLQDAPEFPAVPLNLPEMNRQEAVLTVEAEYADYSGALHSEEAGECSNGEYVTGFSGQEDDKIQAAFMIPAAQHYDITVSVRTKVPGSDKILLNGEEIGTFSLNDTEHFTRVTVSGIYLPAGQAEVSVQPDAGTVAVDYFEISNNTELEKIRYKNHYELSDKQASESALKLMDYLSRNYGKNMLTGQYASGTDNKELDDICQTTGKYPAIRFGEMQSYSNNTMLKKQDIIGACEKWSALGGIVGLCWNWDAPSGISSIWADETDFSLSDTIPEMNLSELALMSEQEIASALENNQISEECAAILRDIDSVSEALKSLSDKEIPVLWRPLPEAGGGWYWWGADGAQSYRWLWDLLYQRMTEYHQLHNLIWIWNGQSEDYLVDKYDIAAMDIYLDENQEFQSRYEEFVTLYRMTKHKKILAVSECGTVPDMNFIFRDNTVWSFMGLWYEDYLSELDSETLINFYNSEKVLTLDNVREGLK